MGYMEKHTTENPLTTTKTPYKHLKNNIINRFPLFHSSFSTWRHLRTLDITRVRGRFSILPLKSIMFIIFEGLGSSRSFHRPLGTSRDPPGPLGLPRGKNWKIIFADDFRHVLPLPRPPMGTI